MAVGVAMTFTVAVGVGSGRFQGSDRVAGQQGHGGGGGVVVGW